MSAPRRRGGPSGALRLGVSLAICATLAATATGCTRKETLRPSRTSALRVAVLAPNGAEAPIYAAMQDGHFSEAGLRVSLVPSPDPGSSLAAVSSGRADIAISSEPALLEASSRGAHLVSVAALARSPLSAAIWIPSSGIRSPADLASKRVGTTGADYQPAFAAAMARAAGARAPRIATRNVGSAGVASLEQRQVQALVAYSNREGVELRQAGLRPAVAPVTRYGVPRFDEFVVCASSAALSRQGDLIRSFVGALVRGTRDLRHPAPGVLDALAAPGGRAASATARAELQATLPELLPPPGKPYGYQDGAQWRAFAAWLASTGLVPKAPSPASAFTNRYLPGGGL